MVYADRIETRRGGAEDIFSDGPPRWVASFVIEADQPSLARWRAFLQKMQGAQGLAYVHDVSDPAPMGGARTAAALAASTQSAVDWSNGGAAVALVDGSGDPVTSDLLAPAPSISALRVAAAAASGADRVTVEGLWPSLPGVVRAGEYIQIGHWLYTSTHDAISGPNGRAVVRITPDLRRSAAVHAPVRLSLAATVMRLDQQSLTWSRTARSRRWPFTVTFREVLPAEGVPY
jgi:hypothetical protein